LWLISILLGSVHMTACSSRLEPQDYMAWVENYDNGLHIQRPVGPFVFDLQYKPSLYMLLQQTPQITPAQLKEVSLETEMQYYTLTLGLADGKGDFLNYQTANYTEQQQKLYYFSYLFQDHIYLEEDGKKLPCLLFHFERSYDLKPSRTFVLGFESPSKGLAPAQVVIESPWLNTGPVKLQIEKKDTPTVQL
jgi:hypothetical protein